MLHLASTRVPRGSVLLIVVASLIGCVERMLVVRTDPPGARVLIDGREVGESPYSESFVFYGTREICVRAQNHVTRTEMIDLDAPWWQVPPIDFVTEVLWPFTERDQRDVFIQLEPIRFEESDLDAVLIRARDLKDRSQAAR